MQCIKHTMRRTQKRRRMAEPESQQQANEKCTWSAADADFATAALAQAEFLPLEEVKIEILDHEAVAFKEHESNICDIKPGLQEIQQWFSHNPANTVNSSTASASESDLRDSSQVTYEIIEERESSDYKNIREKLKPAAINESDFNFDVDLIDMQETDSDEDGYSDIDFEDYEILDDDEMADMYDPEWLVNSTIPRKVFLNQNSKGSLKDGPTSHWNTYYFYNILGKQNFFKNLTESCNKRAREAVKSSQKWRRAYPKPFTWKEISIFIGISLQMGSMQLSTLAEYWAHKSYHCLNGFSTKMSLHRFEFILEVFNFECFQDDHNSLNNHDKTDIFYDLKPLLCLFNNRMESIYNCGESIVLKDPLIYWKGKLKWENEMSQKFRRNAVKLHFLTEQSGLILKILADLEEPQRKPVANNPKARVVQRLSTAIELLKEKFGKGHIVFASKYYGSYALCLELSKLGTYSTGFLDNKTFGNSKELVLKNLDQYEFETRYSGFILMGKSRRRGKCTYFYSSDCIAIYRSEMSVYHDLKLLKEINRQLKTDSEIRAHMVDYQLALERTEIKWDRRLMLYVIHLILLNSYLLNKNSAISYNQFRQEIIQSLLNPDENRKCNGASRMIPNTINTATKNDEVLNLTIQQELNLEAHCPMDIPRSKGKLVKKRCRICFKGGLLIFSQFCCGICPGMPGLCEEPCFKIWHDIIVKKRPQIK